MRCSGGGLSRLLQRLGRSRRKTRPGTDLAFAPALPEATFATVNLFSAGFARPLEPGAPAALVLDP
jgi:hypothetical protein